MSDESKPKVESTSETLTKTYSEVPSQDSSFFGVSVRAWLAILLVGAVCLSYLLVVLAVLIDAVRTNDFSKVGTFANVGEPMYSMSVAALAFYFGQKSTKP